jgi:transposase-like protein
MVIVMAQHFLLSRNAKTLSLADVIRMTDEEAETLFRELRWPETGGDPVCPHCGGLDAYDCRRGKTPRFRCRQCKKDFSITSGTIFASRKLSLRLYLAAVAIFMNEVKGKNALALSRDLGISYKASFVLAHKLRESMGEDFKNRVIGDDRPEAEVDGAVFGHYVKPANFRENRVDRRHRSNRSKRRRFVVVVRERGGESLPAVFKHESHALDWIKQRVEKDTVLHADEAPAWNDLHAHFEMRRINHDEAYSDGLACTNWAESYFSRLRRAEAGHHHAISGPYLLRYAQEASWREDNRRMSNGDQVHRVLRMALGRKPSRDFGGYWQRANGNIYI